jgi:hypothetical protein
MSSQNTSKPSFTKCWLWPHQTNALGTHTAHMDRHRKQYKFFCSVCSQDFITETSKNLHEAGHADGVGGLLICEVCETVFTEEDLLYRHLDDVHDLRPRHGCYDLGKNNGERGEQTGIRDFFDEAGIQYLEEYFLFLPITPRGGGVKGRRVIT